MNASLSVQELVERVGKRLQLRWLTGDQGRANQILGTFPEAARHALVGPLNCIHPNRIQVIGFAELAYLKGLGQSTYWETIEQLFGCRPAAILFADGIEPAPEFQSWSQLTECCLIATPLDYDQVSATLQYVLTQALARRITLHGVFMEVLGMGVLLTGESAVGKSELALALISRGHRLIADDAPEFAKVAPDVINGTCPALLRDFLEVRGLGILNVRAMFGDSAVRRRKDLHLIVNLKRMTDDQLAQMDRLEGTHSSQEVMEVPVPELTLPVAPGRNLAVLVEAAVRHHALRLLGYDASQDFADRQHRAILHGKESELLFG